MNELLELTERHGVLVAAHRGTAGANIPCNTMAAFDIALKSGARILEMDVFLSTDGRPYIFHTGMEPVQLGMQADVTKMTSREIETLRRVNADGAPTKHGLDAFDDVLEHFKGKDCLLNLDRCGDILADVIACVDRHGMREQILLKTAPKPEILKVVESCGPGYMYMPIYKEEDTATELIEGMNIHLVGAELVFRTEDSPVAQEAYLEKMKKKGLVLWGNSLLYNEAVPLAAGHSDDASMIEGPETGWGWLADKGFGVIQTDWVPQCSAWLKEKGLSR